MYLLKKKIKLSILFAPSCFLATFNGKRGLQKRTKTNAEGKHRGSKGF
jgi:hypothetical protein